MSASSGPRCRIADDYRAAGLASAIGCGQDAEIVYRAAHWRTGEHHFSLNVD